MFPKYLGFTFVLFVSLILSNPAYSQQAASAYDSSPPSNNALSYEIPVVSERDYTLQDDTPFEVTSIDLYRIIPLANDGQGKEQISNAEINAIINEFLSATNGRASFNQIRELTFNLTLYYRNAGELLTRVLIPAQTISNGKLSLAVLKGTLGKVNVIGNEKLDSSLFEDAFASQVGKVITRDDAESALLRIQNLVPGASSIGVFGPGETLGESDITLELTSEEDYSGFVYADNHGSAFTGEHRAGLHFEINNPFQGGDQLVFDLIANERPNGVESTSSICCNGGVRYQGLTKDLKRSFGIEWFRSAYDVGNVEDQEIARLNFSGTSTKLRAFMNYHATVSRNTTTMYTFGMSRTTAETLVTLSENGANIERIVSLDELAEFDLSYKFSSFTEGGSVYYGQVGGVYEIQDGALSSPFSILGFDRDANFGKNGELVNPPTKAGANESDSFRVTADLNALYFMGDAGKIKLRLNAQYSNDVLVPVQQISLAGPTAVRAYPVGSYVSDTGGLFSVDYIQDFNSTISMSIFYDVAYGENNESELVAVQQKANMAGIGLGMVFRFSDYANISVTGAKALNVEDDEPILGSGGREAVGRSDVQFYASLAINF